MSAPPKSRGTPITGKSELVEYLEAGNKPGADWRIGTEHEKFVFDLTSLRAVSYEAPNGIGALLKGLQRFGWEAINEDGKTIALTMEGCNITLEPGGQFELSGAPLQTIHQTCAEVGQHLSLVRKSPPQRRSALVAMAFHRHCESAQ